MSWKTISKTTYIISEVPSVIYFIIHTTSKLVSAIYFIIHTVSGMLHTTYFIIHTISGIVHTIYFIIHTVSGMLHTIYFIIHTTSGMVHTSVNDSINGVIRWQNDACPYLRAVNGEITNLSYKKLIVLQ